jgi:hypothetical protein
MKELHACLLRPTNITIISSRFSELLQAGRSEDRIPLGAHPTACEMGTKSFSRGGKVAGAWR